MAGFVGTSNVLSAALSHELLGVDARAQRAARAHPRRAARPSPTARSPSTASSPTCSTSVPTAASASTLADGHTPSRQRAERRARRRGHRRSRPPGLVALRGLRSRRHRHDTDNTSEGGEPMRSPMRTITSCSGAARVAVDRCRRVRRRRRATPRPRRADTAAHRRPPRPTPPRRDRRTGRHRGAGHHRAGGEVDYMWTPNADVLAGAEGQVNIVAWAGYIEDGSTDPADDWVTPFEDITGCAVNVKLGATSDEMVQLMQSGEYDGVSASGDATQRLIAGGEVVRDRPRRVHQLRRHLRGPQAPAVELGRRRAVRHAPRPWRQPAGVQHRGVRRRRSRLVERHVRRRHRRRRRRLGLRQPHLHRRRGAVPDGHAARARHHQPVRARPGRSSTRRSRCSSSRRRSPVSTGR